MVPNNWLYFVLTELNRILVKKKKKKKKEEEKIPTGELDLGWFRQGKSTLALSRLRLER